MPDSVFIIFIAHPPPPLKGWIMVLEPGVYNSAWHTDDTL